MLSAAQLGVWVAQAMNVESPAFNIAEYIEIFGTIEPELFERALRQVIAETDALHLRIIESEHEPQQCLAPDSKWRMPFIDLSTEPDPRHAAEAWMREDMTRAVDPTRDSLFSYVLFRLSRDRFFWYTRYHHLCMDGLGGALLAQKVAALYSALARGGAFQSDNRSSFYALLDDEAEYRRSAQYEIDRDYWRQQVENLPEVVTLSGKRPVKSHRFFRSTEGVPGLVADSLGSVAKASGASLPQVITAAILLYVHRVTGACDFAVGTPLTARTGRQMRCIPGMTSNILPLRIAIAHGQSFRDLLKQAGQRMRGALRHQRYPAADLRHHLGLKPDETDIYGVVVNVMSFDYDLRFAGHAGRAHNLSNGPVDELSIVAYDRQDHSDLRIDFDANPTNYSVEELSAHQRRFLQLLNQVVADADLPLYQFEILSVAERRTLLEDFNATEQAVAQATLPQLLELQAARTPGAVALIAGKDSLSYAELNERSNQLAHYLIELGAEPERLVGIFLKRSVEMLIAMLGVLKSGAAYLPLDPDYPQGRLNDMLNDAAPFVVLCTETLSARLPPIARAIALDVQEAERALGSAATHNPIDAERGSALLPHHPAYVIYTSGSTGRPKGVVIEHRNTVMLAAWAGSEFSSEEWSGVLAGTSICFDLSIFELIVTLVHGGTVILAESALELPALASRDKVRLINTVPSAAKILIDSKSLPANVQTVNLAGEALPNSLVQDLYCVDGLGRVYNLYGPSESTTYSTFALCNRDTEAEPSIGSPIWNTRTYVLDSSLEPLPIGAAGELYVAGPGLARGYLHRPALTSERFVADPYGTPGTRMYRTGDLARWRSDGALEFLGRNDQQVKIRGLRIELGEIEAALCADATVAQAVVIAYQDDTYGKQLAAYVVPADGTVPDLELLRRKLSERLPDYMMPATLVTLDALPRTPNGKLDRRGLPAPNAQSQSYRAPRTPEEEILCAIFAELLTLERVSIDDNFFHLGGHSLTAMRLAGRVRSSLGVELNIRRLFDAPTIAQLAWSLHSAERTHVPITPRPRPEYLPLSYAQQQLWFLYRMAGPSATYNIPLALRVDGELDAIALERALADVVARHETLRTIFPERDGIPFQQILAAEDARAIIHVHKEVVTEIELAKRLADAAATEFDLCRQTPLRVWLFQIQPRSHVLLFLLHHIASDAWSLGVLARDFGQAYATQSRREAPAFAELPVQYADYAMWQRELLGSESDSSSRLSRELEFWRKALAGAPEELNLSSDRPRPQVMSYRGAMAPVQIGPRLHRALLQLARDCGASLFMVLQAGLAALLSRLGAGDDIPIGTPIAGRGERTLEDLLGFLVNTLVMRVDVSGNPSFKQLVARVRAFALEAYGNQDVPFERVVEALQPARSLSRHPLFQVMLVLQNVPERTLELPGLTVRLEPITQNVAKFDLTLALEERLNATGEPLGIEGVLEYSLDLFEPITAARIANCMLRLLEAAVALPDVPLHRLDILDSEQLHRLLTEFNATVQPVPKSMLPQLFETQVSRTPHAVALISGEERLSYAELNAHANRLSHYLIGLGAGPESRVGVCLERSSGMVIALLAILKAGATFLPLEPDYPELRLAQIVEASSPAVVLTSSKFRTRLPHAVKVLSLDTPGIGTALDSASTHNPKTALLPDHSAYVIFTSGTTGTPKGVIVEHGALANKICTLNEYLGVGPGTRFAAMTSSSFDPLLEELLCPLCAGGAAVIISDHTREDAQAFANEAQCEELSIVNGSPRLIESLLPKGETFVHLKALLIGGDVLSTELANRLYSAGVADRIVNFYGPTEVCIDATAHELRGANLNGPVPIGRPLANYRVYVLDQGLHPVPVGVRGELYVAGAGMARGYLNRPALTAERFVADPYALKAGEDTWLPYRVGRDRGNARSKFIYCPGGGDCARG
jgi:nonribosomal peptide synthetase DhbF